MEEDIGNISQVALVTGGSRGIGRAIGLRLAREGMKVAVNYRHDAAAAEEVVGLIRDRHGEAFAVQGSVQSEPDAERIVDAAAERFGRLTVLVNNAGIIRDKYLFMMKESDWRDVIDVNFLGPLFVSRAALRHMLEGNYGRIVNINSVSGVIGAPGQANYAASKAAIIGFTRSLSLEVARNGITVNALAAGYVDTAMTQGFKAEARARYMERIPVRRFADSEEIAAAAAFLCSPEAGYITGQVMTVDGGVSLS